MPKVSSAPRTGLTLHDDNQVSAVAGKLRQEFLARVKSVIASRKKDTLGSVKVSLQELLDVWASGLDGTIFHPEMELSINGSTALTLRSGQEMTAHAGTCTGRGSGLPACTRPSSAMPLQATVRLQPKYSQVQAPSGLHGAPQLLHKGMQAEMTANTSHIALGQVSLDGQGDLWDDVSVLTDERADDLTETYPDLSTGSRFKGPPTALRTGKDYFLGFLRMQVPGAKSKGENSEYPKDDSAVYVRVPATVRFTTGA